MAEEKDTEILPDGRRAVDNWLRCQEDVQRAESAVSRAKTNLINAEDALTKWLLPPDAKPGEKIAVWYVDSLIQVEVPAALAPHIEAEGSTPAPRPIITVRLRGKHGLNRGCL